MTRSWREAGMNSPAGVWHLIALEGLATLLAGLSWDCLDPENMTPAELAPFQFPVTRYQREVAASWGRYGVTETVAKSGRRFWLAGGGGYVP